MTNPLEKIDIVDDNDNVVGLAIWQQVHQQMLLHRYSGILVIDHDKRVLCKEQIPASEEQTGQWSIWFGGHTKLGEDYKEAAVRQIKNLLNTDVTTQELTLFGKRRLNFADENLICSIYAIQKRLDIDNLDYNKTEIKMLEWLDIGQLKTIYGQDDEQWEHLSNELEILDWLDSNFKGPQEIVQVIH